MNYRVNSRIYLNHKTPNEPFRGKTGTIKAVRATALDLAMDYDDPCPIAHCLLNGQESDYLELRPLVLEEML